MLVEELELPGAAENQQAQELNDAAMALDAAKTGGPAAISMVRRAIALAPDLSQPYANLGLLLWRSGDIPGAYSALRRAIDMDRNVAAYWGNFGVFLSSVGDGPGAETALREAIRLAPDQTGPKWDAALLKLWQGEWTDGLKQYEVRRAFRGPKHYPGMPAPYWNGEDLDGKTLYIQGEQGVGDRILFSRYIAWVKKRWPTCRILVCIYDELINLFWEFRGICEFLPKGIPWPEIDYGCFLCSLPAIHGSTPNHVFPDPGLILKRIDRQASLARCNLPQPRIPGLKVGLCWTGNPDQSRNADRSIPLQQLLPLAEDPKVTLYSLQCGQGQADIRRLNADDLICDLGPEIEREGYVGTGVALLELDLVITVCTSVAHLAGSIGVPCWTMLCTDPYWIWLRQGDRTPWYPNMTLFRQIDPGDWQPVIRDVKRSLTQLADAL